jgi:plastocyanin
LASRTGRHLVFGVAALGVLLWSMSPGAAAGAAKRATHTVVIDGTRFQPESLTIKAGDSVVWVNKDPFPHTATSEAGAFDSSGIQTGQSWKLTPRAKGEFAYVCTFHPTMKGVLRVK